MTLLDPAVEPADFDRDQWGRPLIVPEGADRPVPYTRASSAAKTVEDTYNLELWARRNVVYGMTRDASLAARVLALGGDPSTWDLATKKQANRIVEDATSVALAHKRADIGTAVHRLTERLDRGEQVVAGPYEDDLSAYVTALAAAGFVIDPAYIECRLVCDELQMAGTADRLAVRASDGMHVVADLKTGETVDYGALGWAAQLAAYAHGQLYDPGRAVRLDTPALDRAVGYIIHLPAGQGRCTLYEIDLVAGHRAAVLANEIRAVRREARRWISPLAPSPEVAAVVARHPAGGDNSRREALRARYRALGPDTQDDYRALGVDPDDLDAVGAALDILEQGPVVVVPAAAAGPTNAELHLALGRGHDEGAPVDDDAFDALAARYEPLPDAAKFWVSSVIGEARRAGVTFLANHDHTERRFWLYSGLITLAATATEPEQLGEVARAYASSATGSEAHLFPSITVGHAVGAMGATQARAFADLCDTHA